MKFTLYVLGKVAVPVLGFAIVIGLFMAMIHYTWVGIGVIALILLGGVVLTLDEMKQDFDAQQARKERERKQ